MGAGLGHRLSWLYNIRSVVLSLLDLGYTDISIAHVMILLGVFGSTCLLFKHGWLLCLTALLIGYGELQRWSGSLLSCIDYIRLGCGLRVVLWNRRWLLILKQASLTTLMLLLLTRLLLLHNFADVGRLYLSVTTLACIEIGGFGRRLGCLSRKLVLLRTSKRILLDLIAHGVACCNLNTLFSCLLYTSPSPRDA